MLGETLVEECVVGVEQRQDAAVLAQNAREEELRFLAEAVAESIVEFGERVGIWLGNVQIPEVQPLPGEVGNEGIGAWIVQHAAHLLLKNGRVSQTALTREIQQFIVRDAAPEE